MRFVLLFLIACGPKIVYHTPGEVTARYPLSGWPLNRIDVQVEDARAQKKAGSLPASVKASIEKSMSPPILNPGEKLVLKVSIDDLVAKLEDGKWKAEAKVSAILSDVWGKNVASYAGNGKYSKTDTLGVHSGELASEEALNEAVRQLLKSIDGASMPVPKG